MKNPICSRCGEEVLASNNAVLFDGLLQHVDVRSIHGEARHLLPVYDENGIKTCIGSPSRAQYLEGQPKDTRGGHDYHPEVEDIFRAIYAEMCEGRLLGMSPGAQQQQQPVIEECSNEDMQGAQDFLKNIFMPPPDRETRHDD